MSKSRPSSAKVATKSAKSAAKRQTVSTRKPKQARSAPKPTKQTAKQTPATKPAPTAPAVAPTVKPAPGTAAILAIGDEVLRGEITNSNATFLADRLFDAGYDVRAHRVVSDAPADIRAAL